VSMRFYHRLIRSLILPNNAGPNDPATVIGPDIPDELKVYYGNEGLTVVQATILRQDEGTYVYLANITSNPVPGVPLRPQMGIGTCEKTLIGTKVVREVCRVNSPLVPALPAMTFGATSFGSELVVRGMFSTLQIVDGATLILTSGSNLNVDNGADFVYRGHVVDPGEYIYQTTGLTVTNSTSPQLIPGFQFDVEPGWAYHATALLSVTGASAGGLRVDWSRTGGIVSADIRRFPYGPTPGTTNIQSTAMQTGRRDADADAMYGVDGGAVPASVIEEAVIIPSGSGTVGVRAAQAVSDATPTVVSIASRLIVRRGVLMN
jgi:hypothetical protein